MATQAEVVGLPVALCARPAWRASRCCRCSSSAASPSWRSSPTCWRPTIPRSARSAARFRPPAWEARGSVEHLLGTDHLGRDVLSRLIFGARVSMVVGFTAVIFAGVVGTVLGIRLRLPRRLGRPGHHAHHRYLAGPAGADVRHLPHGHRRPQRDEHRHHPGPGLLDALRARHPRRGALAQGARVRAAGHRGGMLQVDHHAAPHPAQRPQLRDRARHADAGRGDRHRGGACRSSASACRRPSPPGG